MSNTHGQWLERIRGKEHGEENKMVEYCVRAVVEANGRVVHDDYIPVFFDNDYVLNGTILKIPEVRVFISDEALSTFNHPYTTGAAEEK